MAKKSAGKKVALFKNGRSQSVRIPKAFELKATEVVISRLADGSLLIKPVKLAKTPSLLELLASWEPMDFGDAFDFVDVPPEPVEL